MNKDKIYYVSGWVQGMDENQAWYRKEFKPEVRIQSYSPDKGVLWLLIAVENDWDGFEIKEILNKEEIK